MEPDCLKVGSQVRKHEELVVITHLVEEVLPDLLLANLSTAPLSHLTKSSSRPEPSLELAVAHGIRSGELLVVAPSRQNQLPVLEIGRE